MWVPDHVDQPQQFRFELTDADGRIGSVHVDQQTFEQHRVGDLYQAIP